jgi:PD-(D/E)XK endonuclease
MNPSTKGEITEAMVLATLLKNGSKVLVPFGSSLRYDIVIENEGNFQRVQCKTGRLRRGVIFAKTVVSVLLISEENKKTMKEKQIYSEFTALILEMYTWFQLKDHQKGN